MLNLKKIQFEIHEWAKKNFPTTATNPTVQFLGVVEEVGELSHAILKQRQSIRGTYEEHEKAKHDAVGDILIYLMNFCSASGYKLDEILEETWDTVKQRDWNKNKNNGSTSESGDGREGT